MLTYPTKQAQTSYELPNKYGELSPLEKAKTLRECIVRFLQNMGTAPKSFIFREIRAPNPDSVKRALDYLRC